MNSFAYTYAAGRLKKDKHGENATSEPTSIFPPLDSRKYCKPCAGNIFPLFNTKGENINTNDDDNIIYTHTHTKYNCKWKRFKKLHRKNCVCKQFTLRGLENMRIAYSESNRKLMKGLKKEITISLTSGKKLAGKKLGKKLDDERIRLHKMINEYF